MIPWRVCEVRDVLPPPSKQGATSVTALAREYVPAETLRPPCDIQARLPLERQATTRGVPATLPARLLCVIRSAVLAPTHRLPALTCPAEGLTLLKGFGGLRSPQTRAECQGRDLVPRGGWAAQAQLKGRQYPALLNVRCAHASCRRGQSLAAGVGAGVC